MRLIFNIIVKPWGWMLAGAVILALGAFWTWNGSHEILPAKADLTEIQGTVQDIVKTWKEKYGTERDIKFELEVSKSGGGTIKVIVADDKIPENQVQNFSSQPIVALLRNGDGEDVWELSANGVKYIDYETTLNKETKNLTFQADSGPYFAGGGLILFILGALRLSRRRKAA